MSTISSLNLVYFKVLRKFIIINDFSEDNTFEEAKSLSNNYENFKILNNQKKGLGGAINLGIEKASGENVVIMMAD